MIFQLMIHADENSQHFAATLKGDAIFRFKKNRLPVAKLVGGKNLLLLPLHILQIIRFCKKNNITILHAHHRYFDFAASIAARVLNIPVVTSVQKKNIGKKLFSYKADILIAPSLAIKEHLERYFKIPPKKIKLINNFVSADDLNFNDSEDVQAFAAKYQIPTDRTIILFVGRLSKEKGVDLLLKSMRTLMREYSDLFLLIVGDGDQKEAIRKYCEAKLSNFAIIGSLENVVPCYKLADILVVPSKSDPFPVSVLEAGYFKKAVVASDVDGIPEIIDHEENGLLFPSDDKQGLLVAMRILLEDASLRVRFGNNLHKKINAELLEQNKIPEYHFVYNEIVNYRRNK